MLPDAEPGVNVADAPFSLAISSLVGDLPRPHLRRVQTANEAGLTKASGSWPGRGGRSYEALRADGGLRKEWPSMSTTWAR